VKILLITPYYPPHIGGVERHVYNLARSLKLLGNDVSIVTSDFPLNYYPDKNVIRLSTLCKLFGAPICPFIFKKLNEVEADVVHIHAPPRFFPEATTVFYKFFKRKVPLILTNHAPVTERFILVDVARANNLISLEKAVCMLHDRLLYYWVHKSAQRIIVQGEAMKALLYSAILKNQVQDFSQKIRIIPNGVDDVVFDPKTCQEEAARKKFRIREENIIVFVGRLAKHKGIDYLIKAVKLVKSDFPDVLLLVVGNGNERNSLEYLSQKLDLTKNVRFVGDLPYQNIPLILSTATVLAHPSFYEGVPTVVLEAMSMAKPVIVTDAGCMAEVVQNGQTGFVVEKGNVSQLAQALLLVLSSRKFALNMGKKGRDLVKEKYSWTVVTKKHLDLYEEVLP